MTLLDELKERRDRQEEVLDEVAEAIKEREEYRLRVEQVLDDLDLAIAALQPGEIEITVTNDEPDLPTTIVNTDEGWELEPSPAELFEAEKSEAREQLEREDDASEFAEPDALLTALENDHIVERQPFAMLDEQTCEPVSPFVEPERPALNEQMQDERELTAGAEPGDGYAPVTDEWVETAPGTLAEYTPPTSPDADALARAHDWYSPEKVAARNRFNPWGIFKREPEEVS